MIGSNIRLKGVIWKIIPKLSLYPFFAGALDLYLFVQLAYIRIRSYVLYTLSTDFGFRIILQG